MRRTHKHTHTHTHTHAPTHTHAEHRIHVAGFPITTLHDRFAAISRLMSFLLIIFPRGMERYVLTKKQTKTARLSASIILNKTSLCTIGLCVPNAHITYTHTSNADMHTHAHTYTHKRTPCLSKCPMHESQVTISSPLLQVQSCTCQSH